MGQSIRVALLATSVEFGGIEKVLLTLLRHMDRAVELVPIVFARTDARDRTFLDEVESLGLTPRVLYVDRSRLMHLSPLRHLVDAVAALRKERFDLIHSHGYRADLMAWPLSRCFRVPAVSTCHGFTPTNRRLALYSRLNVIALRRFDSVIAVSAPMRDELVRRKVNPSRIDVIPNAIEALTDDVVESARRTSRERLGIGDDELILGYVGRLSTEKGLEHLIAALSLGSPVEGPWRLLIVGDGPERRALEAMATQAGLDGRVTFAGFQSDASPWYAAMDALILPSLTEGTPMALLEAMAHRVAVIASAVGGVPAVVSDGVSGVLVPPGDRPALCRALRDVASSNTMRQSLAAAGQQTVRDRYNVCNWAAAVRRVYDKVLAHR